MEKWDVIKVDKSVKPIHYSKRKTTDLVVKNEYYVSFGSHTVKRCKLIEIYYEGDRKRITIEVPVKPQSSKGYIDQNGNISHYWVETFILYADEIGTTPEEAVINEVSL